MKMSKKSSMPKYQELSIRCHFLCGFFPWKCQKKIDTQMSEIKHLISILYEFFHGSVKKKLDTQISEIKHLISILYKFFHGNVKKTSIPKCHKLSIPCQFYIDFFPWKRPKKLDTQMSQIKHPISVLYWFFHENVQKSSIPQCQELSIRWHFYLDFSMEMSKKAPYPNVKN